MRLPRRTPVFGRRPTTLSTTPRDSSPLGSARDHIQETGGTAAIMDGRHIQDAGDVCVPVGGVAPHVRTPLTPVAANAHMHDRGTPPAGLMRQAPDHRVTSLALEPATSTPPILTSNTARQHCTVRLNALARHFQAQAIQAHERAQIRAIKDSIGHVEVFQMDGVGTPIIGRPRPLSGHDTPNPANNTYTLTCEEPVYCPDEPGVLTPHPHGARSAWRRAWPARAPRSSRRA